MIFYIIYKLGEFIALTLPLKSVYKLAVFLSDVHYLFAKKDRESVTANLKAIFPNKSIKEIKAIRLAVFRNFAKYVVDFLRFPLLNKENINKVARIENLHYIDAALSKGKGVIALSAHIGNWELAGIAVTLSGYTLGAVVLPHRHKRVDNFFTQQREKKGVIVMHLGNAARCCLKLLHENKIIALVGDRVFDSKGVVVDFFGRPAYFPEGPAILSLRTGAPIIPGFMHSNPDGTFKLVFEKPIEYEACGDKDKDLGQLTAKYKENIENIIRRYPEYWFMFRKFWIEE